MHGSAKVCWRMSIISERATASGKTSATLCASGSHAQSRLRAVWFDGVEVRRPRRLHWLGVHHTRTHPQQHDLRRNQGCVSAGARPPLPRGALLGMTRKGSPSHLPRHRGNRCARSCGTLRSGRLTHSRLRPPSQRPTLLGLRRIPRHHPSRRHRAPPSPRPPRLLEILPQIRLQLLPLQRPPPAQTRLPPRAAQASLGPSLIDCLLDAKDAVATARSAYLQALPETQNVSLLARYNRIVDEGYAGNPRAEPPSAPKRWGRRKQSKALNFRGHSPSILAFLHDFAVPFDKNQYERDLRMMKIRQKISGTFCCFFLGAPFLPTPNSS